MPCYHPFMGFYEGEHTESGAKRYRITSCPDDPVLAQMMWPGSVLIPCGKCVGCRINYSRNWADRMTLELFTSGKGVFVTLTYDNDHVPYVADEQGELLGFTLYKKDVSDFMKRLRSRKRFEDRKLRFYASGEYGPKTLRPHYHMIIFGLSLEDFHDRRRHGMNELKQEYFISDELSEIWSNGYTLMSDVSWNTCAYVARYVHKKIGKELQDLNEGFEKEFTLMSRRPGIAHEYLELHPECLDHVKIYVGDSKSQVEMFVPKYFRDSLRLTDPERFDIMKEQRQKYASDKMILQLQDTTLSYLDKLEQDENRFLNQIKPLKRRLL